MYSAAALRLVDDPADFFPVSIDEQIREFLDGETNGEDLLHALYDNVMGEPVPARLSAILRG
jgi:hypothetical protein